MIKNIFYIIGLIFLLSSCTFIGNVKNYNKTSKELINSIIDEDYEKAYTFFAYDKYGEIPIDTFKIQIKKFRTLVVDNFGTKFDLSFMHAEKTTFSSNGLGPYPTKVQIQLKNDTHFGYFTIIFDDEVNQVLNINIENSKDAIPSMILFWIFGLLPLLVLIFNIYTIRKVVKSDVKRKWLKILGIFILNVPSFTYSIVNGFMVDLLSFQILLGVSFGIMGYISTFWTFGLPIGSFIANYKISQSNKKNELKELEIKNID